MRGMKKFSVMTMMKIKTRILRPEAIRVKAKTPPVWAGIAALVLLAAISIAPHCSGMADEYIIMLQIMDTKKVDDLDVATRVSVQLQLTDPGVKSRDRVVKKTEKDGLYAAMDVAAVWLSRALASK